MSELDSAIAREELRALLVLGIIGTLLGVRDVLDIKLGYGITFNSIVSALMMYWGAYVFLMAVGVSGDLLRPKVADTCATVAALCFILGIASMIGMVIFVVVGVILTPFNPEIALILAGIAGIVSLFLTLHLIIARSDESAQGKSQESR